MCNILLSMLLSYIVLVVAKPVNNFADMEDRIVFPSDLEDRIVFPSDIEDRFVFLPELVDPKGFPSEIEDPKVFPSDMEDRIVFPSDNEDRIVFPSEIEDSKVFPSEIKDPKVFPSKIEEPKVFPSENEDRIVFPSDDEDRIVFPSDIEDHTVSPSDIEDHTVSPSDIEDHTVFPSENIIDDNPKIKPLKHKVYRRISAEKCEEYAKDIVFIMPLTKSEKPIPITIDCTTASMNPLISDGKIAETGEFPHMVAIGWLLKDKTIGYYCGGSLVSEQWVLTAAHCTHHATKGKPSVVRIGANRLSDKSSGVILKIESLKRHPHYMPPTMYADLALLKLRKPVSFTPNVKPACLDSQFNGATTQAWVTGWGAMQFDGKPNDLLLKAKLDIVDNVQCALWHNFTTAVPTGVVPSMLCAGDPNGGWKKDTCQGDSGGPLQIIHPNISCIYSVIGVTSFGSLCGTPDYPGVYTRVSHYIEWIESIVWPED